MKVILLSLALSPLALADFAEEWNKVSADKNSEAKEQFLEKNSKRFEQDPDFWIAYANVAWNRNQGIRIEQGEAKPGDFSIKPAEGDGVEGRITKGEPSGEDIDESIQHLDRALKLAPDRIDIWRGRLDLLHWNKRSDQFLAEADRFGAVAAARKKPFLQKTGKAVEESADATGTSALHSFVITHFRAETKEDDAMIQKVATLIVKHFPDSVYGYNDLALYYDLTKQPKLVLQNLGKAWEIAPHDPIVAMNYAEALHKANEPNSARKVLNALLKSKSLPAKRRKQAEDLLAKLKD